MGFKVDELKELVRLIDGTSIEKFDMEWEGTKLSIQKFVQTDVSVSAAQNDPNPKEIVAVVEEAKALETLTEKEARLKQIISPMVGTFYRAPSPDASPYVKEGDTVNEKTVVCIIEAMKLMNEIEAEVNGEIVEILVENGQLVEYGQPLLLVKMT
jgi:acetyl-CoA carboxylase biotin carboxyl carrier protein